MSSDQKQIITPENTSLIGKPVIIYDATETLMARSKSTAMKQLQ